MKKYLKKSIIWASALFFHVSVMADDTIVVRHAQTGVDEVFGLPEGMLCRYDSLLNKWYSRNYLTPVADSSQATSLPVSDSVYMARLSRIPAVMEMPYNEVVRKYIDLYTGSLRQKVSYMLGAMNFYMPLFEEALDYYGIPNELKYLPVIESALNPTATSRAGASGLWQFMIKTGRLYDLQSNSLIDERRDPIKSTYAAARYLKDLYGIYGDWSLVIAAYNCGPGNVNKAIQRSGGEADYWKIYNYLPKETRGYVPAFIAANYIMSYYCQHGITPMEATLPVASDTLVISRDLHIGQVSEYCHLDMDELRALNPQYKKDIIPGNSMPCTLRLPQQAIAPFIAAGDSVYSYKADEFFKKRRTVKVTNGTSAKASSGKTTYHRIRRGETLSTIARKYGVTVKQLRSWNGIKGSNITAGKRIRVSS